MNTNPTYGASVLRCASILGLAVFLSASSSMAQEKLTYDDDIKPLLRRKCSGCHRDGKKEGGLAVMTYSQLMTGGSSGEVIVSGDPDASRLYLLISHQERPFMPPERDKLDDEDLELVKNWIETGARENKSSKVVIKKPKLDLAVKVNANTRPEGPPVLPRGLSLNPAVSVSKTSAVTALAASPWAPLVAIAGPRQVFLYHTDTNELLGVLPFPEGRARVLKFSRNGTLLLAGGGRAAHSGKVVVWNVKTGERVVEVGDELDSVLAADISADHGLIALGGPSKMLRIYSTADGELLHEIKKHTNWILGLEFSPDGIFLASADRNGGLHVWESDTGREYLNLRGHTAAVNDVSWRSDSNLLASASEDGTIRLWEMENGGNVKRWNAHGGGVLALELFRDGRVATAGRDSRAKLWDQNGKSIRQFAAFSDLAVQVAIDHTGQKLLAADWTGDVRSSKISDGKLIASLATNPPALTVLLSAAEQEVARVDSARVAVERDAAARRSAATKASEELATRRKQIGDRRSAIRASEKELQGQRSLIAKSNKELQAALKLLSQREAALESILKDANAKPEDLQKVRSDVKESSQAVDATSSAIAKATKLSSSTLDKVVESRRGALASEAKVKTLQDLVRKSAKEATSKEKELAGATVQKEQAQRVLAKWKAAVAVDAAHREVEARRAEHRKLLVELAELEATQGGLIETLEALSAEVAQSAERGKATAALAIDLAQAVSESAKVATVKAAGSDKAKTARLTAKTGDEQVTKAAQSIEDLKKSVSELDKVLAASVEKLKTARGAAKTALESAAKTLAQFEKQKAVIAKASAAIADRNSAVEKAKQMLDAALAKREASVLAFEKAREALQPAKVASGAKP